MLTTWGVLYCACQTVTYASYLPPLTNRSRTVTIFLYVMAAMMTIAAGVVGLIAARYHFMPPEVDPRVLDINWPVENDPSIIVERRDHD